MLTSTTGHRGGWYRADDLEASPLPHTKRTEAAGITAILLALAIAAVAGWSWWSLLAVPLAFAGATATQVAGTVRKASARRDRGSPVWLSGGWSGWGMVALGLAMGGLEVARVINGMEDDQPLSSRLLTICGPLFAGLGVGMVLAARWIRPRAGARPNEP
ncbi:hypothetical protein [Georgenia faecalis]|uniref:Uncharacterized protein n=1 Tax=Georgenia faecalis TaxID=2483799 RepID=A0ABV9DCI6_9MICO|nr:hypothetical protein [Georgenia faecalis]